MATPNPAPEFGAGGTPSRHDRALAAGYGCVLLVEHDEVGAQALDRALLKEGLHMLWARSSSEAEQLLSSRRLGLIIFNPRLAPEDGWDAYRRLLRFGVPIMVLAGSTPALQRVALSLGAADSLGTATPPQDIAARVRHLLGQVPTDASGAAMYAGVRLDVSEGLARVRDRGACLTRSECAVLAALMEARGRVLSRAQLVQRARAEAGALPLARSIDAHIRALRRKLGDDSRPPRLIESIRGFGYRLAVREMPAPEDLAGSAFAALAAPSLVVNLRGQVQLMNREAEALLGARADATCGELLGCGVSAADESCPGLRALQTGVTERLERRVCLHNVPTVVEETAASLPDKPGSFVLQLREVGRD